VTNPGTATSSASSGAPHVGRKAKSFGWSSGAAASHPAGLCTVAAHADGAVSSGTAVAAVPSGAYAASASIATDRGRADTDGRAFPSRPPRPLFGSSPRPRWPTTGRTGRTGSCRCLMFRQLTRPATPGNPSTRATRTTWDTPGGSCMWSLTVPGGKPRSSSMDRPGLVRVRAAFSDRRSPGSKITFGPMKSRAARRTVGIP
jgi:hypothetical protein